MATAGQIGLEMSNVAGKTQVDKVLRGFVGSRAGVQVGDEIVALGGYRVTAEQWTDRVGMLEIGQQTTLLVARRGKMLELGLDLASVPQVDSAPSWNLVRVEKPTLEQEKRWGAWLGLPSLAVQGDEGSGTK